MLGDVIEDLFGAINHLFIAVFGVVVLDYIARSRAHQERQTQLLEELASATRSRTD